MCGICGIVSQAPSKNPEPVLQMQRALEHRGPDSGGVYTDPNAVLAVRRLSIIDVEHGQQPLYNEDRSLVLVANGEIYNFPELRAQLEFRGHRFQTHSDCETILHLYEESGIDCVHQLRGMFAFALWDIPKKRLLLVRDRMGEKPLYLYSSGGTLVFASELRALLQSGLVSFELDPRAIDLYFHYQYVPEPFTPLKNVRKLPAGHLLTVDTVSWETKESCYWKMEDAPPLEGSPDILIRDQLEEISKIVIRSDVPVGVALSGGIDSSAIAAMSAVHCPRPLHAFCVGYPGNPHYDERKDAKALAEHLRLPFHEIELRTEEMVSFFPQLVLKRDDPIADISGFGYFSVMKLAKDHGITVMLQGQGGDELFWGYPWVRQGLEQSIEKKNLTMKNIGAVDYVLQKGVKIGRKSFQTHSNFPNRLIFYDLTPDFRDAVAEMHTNYTPDFLQSIHGHTPFDLFTFQQPWEAEDILMTRLICQTYLLENGIAQGDRLSMASSVELRLPLCDYRLVETVIGLRKAHPDHLLPPKAWLKQALSGILPDWVMQRPKRGFQPPVREWHKAIFDLYGSALKEGYLVQSKILTSEAAERLSHGQFPSNAVVPISFKALVLELWCRGVQDQLPRLI